MSSPPRLLLLGPLELVGEEHALRSGRLRRLLAALLVSSGEVVSVDRLADVVWGEDVPAHIEASLQTLVSRLRKVLRDPDPDAEGVSLETRPPGYVLRVSREQLDATRFEDLSERARSLLVSDPATAADQLDAALVLWRGPAYAEFALEDFARPEAVRLEELRATAEEDRAEADLALGRPEEAVARLDALVAAEPLRERRHALLMLAFYRCGRQAEALRVYTRFREALADELGLDPSSDLRRLEAQILGQDTDLDLDVAPARRDSVPPTESPGNLPMRPLRLVGRDALLEQIVEGDLRGERIVTLVGPGGVGKTSLAVRAAQCSAGFPDGGWLVELAAITAGPQVTDLVATTLHLDPAPGSGVDRRIEEALRGKRVLLVLDNCEHVLDATASLVAAISRQSVGVVVLATSREPLGLPGERVRVVPPLPVPSKGSHAGLAIEENSAVSLLLERASAASATFELTEANAAPLVEICRRLDGVPLALELAAARLRSMSAQELVEHLSSRSGLLRIGSRTAAARHRTLLALVDWSYELLEEDERGLFECLSVFASDFTLRAAEAVGGCGANLDVVDGLGRLVDKSMVLAEPDHLGGAASKYRLLETLRAYGRERLAERDQIDTVRRRHARHHVDHLEALANGFHGLDVRRRIGAVTDELDELREAHGWSIEHEPELAVRLVAALVDYVQVRTPLEVFAWADRTLAVPAVRDPAGLPTVGAVAASGARFAGDLARARELAEASLALARAEDDPERRHPLYLLQEVALFEGRLDDAHGLSEDLERLALAAQDDNGLLRALAVRALSLAYGGRQAEAVEVADRLLDRMRAAGAPVLEAWSLYVAGEVRLSTDAEAAVELLEEALRRAQELGDRYLTGVALVSAASAAGRTGDRTRALQLFAEVVQHWRLVGNWTQQWTTVRNVVDLLVGVGADEEAAVLLGGIAARTNAGPAFGDLAKRLERARRTVRDRLGATTAELALGRGATLADDEIVAVALRALAEAARPASSESGLTAV